jgi:predicted nucleic acid-binding protein
VNYLFDTNILSEFQKNRRDQNVIQWVKQVESERIFISVLSLGEIRRGVEIKRKSDPDRAARYEEWLLELESRYANRILDFTRDAAHKWGQLTARHLKNHHMIDLQLAAQALVNDCILVTRNVKDFKELQIKLINPFEPSSYVQYR